jgi:hypothetical protein
MSIQKKPAARQIQPMGFLECLEAMRAQTTGKARKGMKINRSPRASPVPPLGASCAERARIYSGTLAMNMATERPASDQASQEAAGLIPPTPRSCPLVSAVTTPLYSTTVS